MHTATEKKNDPPPPYPHPFLPQEAAQFKQFPFGYEDFYYSFTFIWKIVVDNVYVKLNETSPMLL